MIEFLDKKIQREHYEDLTSRNQGRLSQVQKDFITFERLKEECAMSPDEVAQFDYDYAIRQAENTGY